MKKRGRPRLEKSGKKLLSSDTTQVAPPPKIVPTTNIHSDIYGYVNQLIPDPALPVPSVYIAIEMQIAIKELATKISYRVPGNAKRADALQKLSDCYKDILSAIEIE